MWAAASLIVLSSSILAQSEMKSSREDFRAFGDLITGRWKIDVTYIADWPDQTKKQGDVLTIHQEDSITAAARTKSRGPRTCA